MPYLHNKILQVVLELGAVLKSSIGINQKLSEAINIHTPMSEETSKKLASLSDEDGFSTMSNQNIYSTSTTS